MNLAIIPARGGSKRIPRKNIRPFFGKPVISYAIEVALSSELFNEIMVSTDDEEIANIAQQYGATVPFFRSEKNADDFATTAAVLLEVLYEYQKSGINYDLGCCIYPVTPLLTGDLIKKGHRMMMDHGYNAVFPVLRYSYPIQRSLKIKDGKISFIWPQHKSARSQDLSNAYYDAGQFYWFKVQEFLRNKGLLTNNTGALIISDMEAQDVDTLDDWKLAEFKYKYSKKREI